MSKPAYGFAIKHDKDGWYIIDKTGSAVAFGETDEGIEQTLQKVIRDHELSIAARALRAIPSERRSEQSRINGRKNKSGGRPTGEQPWKAAGISRQAWYARQKKGVRPKKDAK